MEFNELDDLIERQHLQAMERARVRQWDWSETGIQANSRVMGHATRMTRKRSMPMRWHAPRDPEGRYVTAEGEERECGQTLLPRSVRRAMARRARRMEVIAELFGNVGGEQMAKAAEGEEKANGTT